MPKLPVTLETRLGRSFGGLRFIEPLSGVDGQTGCYRVHLQHKTVIVKKANAREYTFYTSVAPKLQPYGVTCPELFWSQEADNGIWIVIEDIPLALPRNRWRADPQVLEVLQRLHAVTWDNCLETTDPFIPVWSNEITDKCLQLFTAEVSDELRPILCNLQVACRDIFAPLCCISGDPNPTNWGIRDDGSVVLYDWERFGYGSPAIDLAITIPGMGTEDRSIETLVAAGYLDLWHKSGLEAPFDVNLLVDQMAWVKIWTAVEFLANNRLDEQTINGLTALLGKRLQSLKG